MPSPLYTDFLAHQGPFSCKEILSLNGISISLHVFLEVMKSSTSCRLKARFQM